jgi:3-(3-hydroxy-phenyl)propionate hydroxylase
MKTKTHTNPVYPFVRSPDQDSDVPVHHPVVIVGAGPTGLAAALDLASQGIATVVLDDNNTVSVGSRAICMSKRSLEICDRLGCAGPMLDKGITWQVGKVFFKEKQIYQFNLLPGGEQKMSAFINLQQYYFEEYLVNRVQQFDTIDLRWKSKVCEVESHSDSTRLKVVTPEGDYHLTCDYLLVADGANSPIRESLGLASEGQIFTDQFLIADIRMHADFPTERWFWFDPPFHPNQSVLLHRQPGNVWRIDFQLGQDTDPAEELREENIGRRIHEMLGEDVDWDLEWASVYTFRCRRMKNFIHNRVVFMGDAAHQVSPFGARGANGALQSTENLAWKLARILQGRAPAALLETYDAERRWGADENILNSTRATDFITPKNGISRIFRDETLRLAEHYPFARSLVNSGRLSVPCVYEESPLNTPDNGSFASQGQPGSVCPDAPVEHDGRDDWLLQHLGGSFAALVYLDSASIDQQALASQFELLAKDEDLRLICIGDSSEALPFDLRLADKKGLVASRLDLRPGSVYLIRPDQHVAGRWRAVDAAAVIAAKRRATGFELGASS